MDIVTLKGPFSESTLRFLTSSRMRSAIPSAPSRSVASRMTVNSSPPVAGRNVDFSGRALQHLRDLP